MKDKERCLSCGVPMKKIGTIYYGPYSEGVWECTRCRRRWVRA